jgi:hypothetical protein
MTRFAVFAIALAVYKVSLRDAICTRVESARRPQRVSSGLLIVELAHLLGVKAAARRCRGGLRPALTRKFCQQFGNAARRHQPDWRKGGEYMKLIKTKDSGYSIVTEVN